MYSDIENIKIVFDSLNYWLNRSNILRKGLLFF